MNLKDNKGFMLLITFVFMAVLTIVVGGFVYTISTTTRSTGTTAADYKMLELADAGIERARRTIVDDYQTPTVTGTADLRGGDASLSNSAANQNNIRYITTSGSGYATINANGVIGVSGDYAILRTFDSNHVNAPMISAEIHAVAVRNSGGGSNSIAVYYTTDGSAYTKVLDQAIPSSIQDLSASVAGLDWPVVMSPNFRLAAIRTGTGTRQIRLYSMYLRVTYGICTQKAPSWYASYGAGFSPITLGEGTIQSVAVTDEQGKVHLNTASQALLHYTMVKNGVADATANTLATAIGTYRTGANGPFDSVEELQQVPGMTNAIYTALAPDVTVYSYINTSAQNPAGSRAPVNINTASPEVLFAIFRSITALPEADCNSLVSDITTQRDAAPFTCYYSANSAVTTDFYDFVRARSYLSDAEDDAVLSNADASFLQPTWSGGASGSCLSTEFCYNSSAFNVNSLGRVGTRNVRAQTIVGHDGSRTFTTYAGDPAPAGWRKENFE